MIKQIFWRGLVFLRLTLPLVTDQLVQYVSTLGFLCFDIDTFGKPQLYCLPLGYNNQ